jgi:CBS domain-containing protein
LTQAPSQTNEPKAAGRTTAGISSRELRTERARVVARPDPPSVTPQTPLRDALATMRARRGEALLVLEGGRLAGIFTERDVLRRVIGEQRNPASCTVAEVMTEDVICCRPETDLDEVAAIMQQKKVRHIPVCDDDGLHGMISIGDVNAYHASTQEAQIHFLSEYIYGRV